MKLKIIWWRIFEFYNVFTWLRLTQWDPRKKCNPTSVFQHQRIAVVVLRHQKLESLLINVPSCGLNWMTLLIRPWLCLVDHHRIFLSPFCLKGSSSAVFTHSFSLARVSQLTTATNHATMRCSIKLHIFIRNLHFRILITNAEKRTKLSTREWGKAIFLSNGELNSYVKVTHETSERERKVKHELINSGL